MTCTHCGAPSTQPSGPCATCAPPTAWPQSDGDGAPSGLVAPPKYDETVATPDLQEPPSGLPHLGALPAPHIEQADATQYEPTQLPAFAPPPPADPHLISQYSAALPATNAPSSDQDTVPLPSAAAVAAHYSPATVSASAPVAAQYTAGVPATSPVAAQYTAGVSVAAQYSAVVSATAPVPGQPTYAPAAGQYSAAPTAPATHAPGPYGASAPTPYGAPAPQYAPPANAQQFTAPPPLGYAAAPPYGAPSPYAPGSFPYQAGFPDQAPAVPAPSVLGIVAIVLAAFAFAISFFVSPLVPAAGAVVCASIGLRRGERLAKLGLILGIVATVYGLGILALNVIALVLL
jgi:hypothetical protein